MKKRVTKDFETRSKCNLKLAGAYKYSLDPTTQPTCLAFKILGEPTVYFLDFKLVNTPWKKLPAKLKKLWLGFIEEGYEFSAHNSYFEKCIYDNIMVKRYGWPKINPRKRRCTAAKAASCALPRSLEGVGEVLKLRIQKDKRGYNAMMATCKPTKKWNAWKKACDEVAAGKRVGAKKLALSQMPEPPVFLEPDVSPETFNVLYTYCKIDVRTEELVDETLPDLNPQEQEIWFMNQELNWRGLHIDIPTVKKIVSIMEIESKKKLKELDSLTMGLVTKPGARKSILEFLELDGIVLPDIKAATVQDELDGFNLTEDARKLLEIRKALSKTSTRKYQSFLNRANEDNRVRDIQMYWGASTGRDTGTGIQIQNFPRGLIKFDKNNPYSHFENVKNCHPEMLQILYGDSLGILFSALLRNMIIPTNGHELFVADFSKIEVAVLWWLADNTPGIKILKQGGDPYITLAMINHPGKKAHEITDEERQLAKHQILGCGFGMGWSKFQQTGWDLHRLKLSENESRIAVKQYRELFSAVPGLWRKYEDAALAAVEHEGKIFHAGLCSFIVKNKFLWIELPSKRRLAYREPQISWRETDYGPKKTLEFWAVNSKTKKWALERTWGGPLAENITQGTARDLLMWGILRLKKGGFEPLFSVHDEPVCERLKGQGDLGVYTKTLCKLPEWARGCPVEAKGWVGPRYRKG